MLLNPGWSKVLWYEYFIGGTYRAQVNINVHFLSGIIEC
jgi:hypothetical protein